MSTVASQQRDLSRRVEERRAALDAFVREHGGRLAEACYEMARRFARGGSLVPFGSGAAATDAAHAAVEFMHPVIVGKRALPALAPSNDPTGSSAAERMLRADDIALGLCHDDPDEALLQFMAAAGDRGCLLLAFSGRGAIEAEFPFPVASDDPLVVQEVQETAYHVLWELVHVFFEHPGLLEESCITCGDTAVEAEVVAVAGRTATISRGGARETVATELVGEVEVGDRLLCHAGAALEKLPPAERRSDPTNFLYPFLDSAESDLETVLADVRRSTEQKAGDVTSLRARIDLGAIERCRDQLAERLRSGGRILSFGNGGSSTDAQDIVADSLARGWPAVCLNNDVATVTAVGNDVGFEMVFSRQLIPLGRSRDVAVAISTSGSSANIIAGLEEAHRRRMLTVAIAGYDGGRLANLPWLEHLFVVESDYIPRIQEAQATIYHLLLEGLGDA